MKKKKMKIRLTNRERMTCRIFVWDITEEDFLGQFFSFFASKLTQRVVNMSKRKLVRASAQVPYRKVARKGGSIWGA